MDNCLIPAGIESSPTCNEGGGGGLPDGNICATTTTRSTASGRAGSCGKMRGQWQDASALPRSTAHKLQSHKRAWHLTAGPGWTKVKSAGFVKALWSRPPPPLLFLFHPLHTLTHTQPPMPPGGKCPEGPRGRWYARQACWHLIFSFSSFSVAEHERAADQIEIFFKRIKRWQLEAAVTIFIEGKTLQHQSVSSTTSGSKNQAAAADQSFWIPPTSDDFSGPRDGQASPGLQQAARNLIMPQWYADTLTLSTLASDETRSYRV